MIETVAAAYASREITRLCHFTPSRNLSHIAAGRTGILATGKLRRKEQAVLNPTDIMRWDGWLSHVCCSIEYPNSWYLKKAQEREALFRDWVILLIDPRYIAADETRFSPRNAAAQSGRLAQPGILAFQQLFAESIDGAHSKKIPRTSDMLSCCPTDDQAEVLVQDQIEFSDIKGVVVRDASQAKREIARLRLGVSERIPFTFIIAPEIFEPRKLSSLVRAGKRPTEVVWSETRPGERK